MKTKKRSNKAASGAMWARGAGGFTSDALGLFILARSKKKKLITADGIRSSPRGRAAPRDGSQPSAVAPDAASHGGFLAGNGVYILSHRMEGK